MSKLENAIETLAAAAQAFDEACTEAYRVHRRNGGTAIYSGRAQIYLQDDVRDIVTTKNYTACQLRAINGALSGWLASSPNSPGSISAGRRSVWRCGVTFATHRHDPAFPTRDRFEEGCLTKREYFAAMALQGFLADGDSPDEAAEWAVEAADYLIEALNKAEEGGQS